MITEYLFLYGTLLAEGAPDEVVGTLKSLRRIGPAHVRGRLYDLGEYPGAVIDHSANTSVHGELVELPADNAILDALDRYEEFDPSRPQKSLFVRKKAKIRLANGRNVQGWIYVYNRNPGNAPVIRGGNYSKSKVA
jgi:gamma-glutamylcyclotransferase (GGCT)/AIG2-like uncharacterized protein YtfP